MGKKFMYMYLGSILIFRNAFCQSCIMNMTLYQNTVTLNYIEAFMDTDKPTIHHWKWQCLRKHCTKPPVMELLYFCQDHP